MASGLTGESRRTSSKGLVWTLVGILVIASAVLVLALTRGGADAPVGLSSTYRMTFDNLTYDIQTDGSLTDVTEDEGGNVSGQMTVGPRLYGTGPITGTFAGKAIDFDGVENGVYTGTVDAHGVLSGTYTYAAQQGTWTATPTDPTSPDGSAGLPWWLWLAAAGLLVLLIGYLVMRRVRRPVPHDPTRGL